MKRLLTWAKPTGDGFHLWNYLWAFKPLLELTKKYDETYLFSADLHSLTSVHSGDTLRQNRRNVLLEYLSIIPEDSNIIIFEQSKVRRINDIAWILSSVTPYSLMLRAHSFKDAQNKNSDINMATFNYPILMAADILTYDINTVPVWKDQKQHLEFARDIAGYFNRRYETEFFTLPEPYIEEDIETIPGTDWRKMSKSYNNFIPLFASKKELKKVIMSIVTDDTPLEEPKNPDTCNVFALIKYFGSWEEIASIREKYEAGNYGYGHAKLELLEIVDRFVSSYRERREFLENNPEEVEKILEKWNARANELADEKYRELIKITWLD